MSDERQIRAIHEPRCNTYCQPGRHYLTSGIGYPHLHRTDLAAECGGCVIPPGSVQESGGDA